jgi:hypothetical protein
MSEAEGKSNYTLPFISAYSTLSNPSSGSRPIRTALQKAVLALEPPAK